MAIFKKRRSDVVDLSYLKKEIKEEQAGFKADRDGMIDFSSLNKSQNQTISNQSSENSTLSSGFDFLANLAGSASESDAKQNNNSTNQNSTLNTDDLSDIKVNLDNLEYKLSILEDRLGKIEENLDSFLNNTLK